MDYWGSLKHIYCRQIFTLAPDVILKTKVHIQMYSLVCIMAPYLNLCIIVNHKNQINHYDETIKEEYSWPIL